MLYFRNDYSEGAHPEILSALCDTNLIKTPGYGHDDYCRRAADRIRELCRAPEAGVHFLPGGTQVNKVAIGAFLRPYEAVISPDCGHINVHEVGAIEHNGHKILPCPCPDGKLTADMIEKVLDQNNSEQAVVPRLVFLSNATELGTVYSRAELEALHSLCEDRDLLLYCDGARLGSAITAVGSDLSFPDYARICDAFTIGGTKNGLLFGEALVVTNAALQEGFRYAMKQQGAVLAKGRLLGVQYETVLRDGLYLRLARHANMMADRLRQGLADLGISVLSDSTTNQIFPILAASDAAKLREQCDFEIIEPMNNNRVCIRFVTSWATKPEEVEQLIHILGQL